jgi:hypothetical protein
MMGAMVRVSALILVPEVVMAEALVMEETLVTEEAIAVIKEKGMKFLNTLFRDNFIINE